MPVVDPFFPTVTDNTLYPQPWDAQRPWVPAYPDPNVGPWIPPQRTIQPWVPAYPDPTIPIPILPQPMAHPSATAGDFKSDRDRITEYRFLVKGIRELVNAGKMDPATALMAIDAMLMALDPDYDKHDAQATK